MKAYTKIRLKLFLLDLIFELVVNSIILSVAILSEKLVETLSFYFAWRVFRFAVPKIFHVKHNNPFVAIIGCGISSCGIYIFAMNIMPNITTSIFSSVIVSMILNYILYKVQDYIDMKKELSNKTKDIYSMSEDELREYAHSKKLSEQIVDTLVLRVIHNYKWTEIQHERNFTKEGIRYHKERIEKVLEVKL